MLKQSKSCMRTLATESHSISSLDLDTLRNEMVYATLKRFYFFLLSISKSDQTQDYILWEADFFVSARTVCFFVDSIFYALFRKT